MGAVSGIEITATEGAISPPKPPGYFTLTDIAFVIEYSIDGDFQRMRICIDASEVVVFVGAWRRSMPELTT
jgi:hypothetical protein